MLTELTVVIILQYIDISNYYAIYFGLIQVTCQLYLKTGEKQQRAEY